MLLSYCFQFIVKTIVSVQCITLFCVECTLCHPSFRHLKKKERNMPISPVGNLLQHVHQGQHQFEVFGGRE